MGDSIYERLQQDFIVIRHMLSGNCYDEALFSQTVDDIKDELNRMIKRKAPERRLMLYCIDTLLEIIAENNKKKIYDFADTIHNMPEIALGKRNIYSFDKEIMTFRKKYRKNYFPDFEKPKPKFQNKAPKSKWEFFSKESDESFKRLHPIGYYILCAVGITAFMLPVFAFVAYIEYINPAENDGWSFVGFVGAFTVGVGLFNIVAAWIHQYLGHFLTIFCILGGSAITALSLFFLYS